MINSVMRGVFLKDPNLRREFLSLPCAANSPPALPLGPRGRPDFETPTFRLR
jgi:hypothetical protein